MQKIKFQGMIPKKTLGLSLVFLIVIEKYNSCIKDNVRNNTETWKIIN